MFLKENLLKNSPEPVFQRCYTDLLSWEILQNSQEIICDGVLFLLSSRRTHATKNSWQKTNAIVGK